MLLVVEILFGSILIGNFHMIENIQEIIENILWLIFPILLWFPPHPISLSSSVFLMLRSSLIICQAWILIIFICFSGFFCRDCPIFCLCQERVSPSEICFAQLHFNTCTGLFFCEYTCPGHNL